MPFFLNIFNYYFKHKGNICSRQPARQQTEPTGRSAHELGQWVYNFDRVTAYSYCSRTSLLSSSFLKISYTKQIGYGSIVTSIYSNCFLSCPQALGCSASLVPSHQVCFKVQPVTPPLASAVPPPRRPALHEGMNQLSSAPLLIHALFTWEKKTVLRCLHGQQQERDSGHPLPLPSSFQKRKVLRARQQHWISQHSAANSAPRVFPAGSPTLPPHHPTGRNNNPCPCTPSGGRRKADAIMPLIYEV